MIDTILTAAGVPHLPARFPDPPEVPYAVTFEDLDAAGADGHNLLTEHLVTVELYSRTVADSRTAVEAIITQLDTRGIPYTLQTAYWLQDVQRYQNIFEFSYYTKKEAV